MRVIKKKERLEIYIENIVYGGNGINKYPNEKIKILSFLLKML